MLKEKDFFDERQETKSASFMCPYCRERADYQVKWLRRTRKKAAPPRATAEDRLRFSKSKDYMVRVDDVLFCSNSRCRKRFEIPNSQSVVFI